MRQVREKILCGMMLAAVSVSLVMMAFGPSRADERSYSTGAFSGTVPGASVQSPVTLTASNDAEVPLTINGHSATQSGKLATFNDSANHKLFAILHDGDYLSYAGNFDTTAVHTSFGIGGDIEPSSLLTSGQQLEAMFIEPYTQVAAGQTASLFAGVETDALRNSGAADAGTISEVDGHLILFGHNSTNATAIATNTYGIKLGPRAKSGTLANLYDIFVSATQTGGTVTNRFGYYQTDTNAPNTFNSLTNFGNGVNVKSGPSLGTGIYGTGYDGSPVFDGVATITLGDGSTLVPSSNIYTLARDIYLQSSTVNNGVTIKSGGFRIFCNGTFANNGTCDCSGGNGAAGASGGTAGLTAPIGSVSVTTNTGGTGNTGNGGNGGAGLLNTVGGAGGAGGLGSGGSAGAAQTSAVPTAAKGGIHIFRSITRCFFDQTDSSTGSVITSGAGGGGGGGDSVLRGGGGGGGGGVLFLCAKTITGTGTLVAKGGNGGAGDPATGGGCGGGGSGGGGVVIVITNGTLVGTQTVSVAAGSIGAHSGTGADGNTGASGNSYIINNAQ